MNRAPLRRSPTGVPLWQRWVERPPAVARLPWVSTFLITLVTLGGSRFAEEKQLEHLPADVVPLDTWGRALLVLGPGLLLIRRRNPVITAFGTAAVCTVYLMAGYPVGPVYLCAVVGVFSAVVEGHRRAAWSALVLLWAGQLLTGVWLYRWLPPSGDDGVGWSAGLPSAAWLVAVAAAGELVRVRREQWARQREEREAAEARRADEERMRIARELHDVLAHSISVINVQAGMGLALLDSDPAQARSALKTIKAASKEALGEVRHVLDTLRTPGDAPRAPAPGLDRLPELAEQAAGAGLRVGTRTEGSAVPLPPGTDLAAFRIIQEALTNVMRHSGSREARVLLSYGDDEVRIRIDDDGPAAENGPSGGGNGLVGMRERAAVLGGTVSAGPRGGGGFRVLAQLPLRAPDTVSGSPEREAQ
ncbi:sensor histidine kinase [Streptomyces sp. N2-109]|uniref:histidine kinase n=1 Tax=Streptomyces gossypii TaxID=2883101 RepID=A0ABT2JVK5_9ACTN|nr:sensor histidine kinase [Streptomyces gossypii]MCT2591355.1 sensor histidine kinase [Streptomyces gossypii]